MHGIDPLTLVIVVSFLAILLSLVIAAMRAGFPRTVRGIGSWAFAIPMFVASSALFSRQDTHPVVHVMFANALILLGMLSMNAGMRRFYELPLPRASAVVLPAAALLAALAWFTFIQPAFLLRVAMMSLVGAALFGHLCWLPLRHGGRSIGSILTASAFGLTVASCLLRLITIGIGLDRPAALLDLGMLQILYLVSFNVSLLIGSVGFILMTNERLRSILEFHASHDALTGALNRGAFFLEAGRAFEHSRQNGVACSVALLDMDHFKEINDRYGHAVGDRVLRDFSARVRETLGDGDIVLGRYGGEEFVLLLRGMTGTDARCAARKLLAALQPTTELPPYTVSIGIAAMDPAAASLDELLHAADQALYRAKRHGRNRVEEWRWGEETFERSFIPAFRQEPVDAVETPAPASVT